MRDATLVYLLKYKDNNPIEICLAMKKRGFGEGKWNGIGGKIEEGETQEQGAKREVNEEIGVEVLHLDNKAEIQFEFENKPEWNQTVYVYISNKWKNEPQESEEMKPKWFKINEIPFDKMWPADQTFLPLVIQNKNLKAKYILNDEGIVKKKIDII